MRVSPGTFSLQVPFEEVESLQLMWASQHQGFFIFVLEFAVHGLHRGGITEKTIGMLFKDNGL